MRANRGTGLGVNRYFLALAVLSPLPLLSVLGCNSTDNGTIQLVVDEEAGTFTQSPVPTELQIVADSADASTVLATAQLPTSTIDLGQQSESAPVVSLNIRGLDSTQTQQVFGASLPVQYSALAGQTIPVFVQRDGQLARLPGPLTDARQTPILAILQGEYMLIAGGSTPSLATSTQLFDFGQLATLSLPPAMPVAPQSLALAGTVAWLIGSTSAQYFDFSASATASLTLPSGGGAIADIAGGATVFDSNGAQYIVGATRLTGQPTPWVLEVNPNDLSSSAYPYGNTTWIKLSAARLGAAATWMSGYGLVVAGGSATAAGVETVNTTLAAAAGVPLSQFPPDPTEGAGAAVIDSEHVLLAGGVTGVFQEPGVRELDLGCAPSAAAPCADVTPWVALPAVLGSAQAFTWSTNLDGLVVGNELLGGKTHVYRLSPTAATEVPTRVPHVNASAAWSPVGSIVLFGGATTLESFVP